jgi:hypothetical protein
MARRKSKLAKLRGLFIRRDGDRYVVEVTQPSGKVDFEVRTPKEVDALLRLLIDNGFSVREFMDAMALSNKFGKSCLR